jgi:hypothetical protein
MCTHDLGLRGAGAEDHNGRQDEEKHEPFRRRRAMSIQVLTDFLMWCTIINFAMLMLTFFICVYAGDMTYRIHGKWFPMPRENFNTLLYGFVGFYKLIFFFFNLIPYVALLLAT